MTSFASRFFDLAELPPRDAYKLMIGSVVPRPIAWVTTVDLEGHINAAPFSFFNCLSSEPPLLAIGIGTRGDVAQTLKDTARNIHLTHQFTVNIVGNDLVEAMNITAAPFAAGVEELYQAGLETIPGSKVVSPRIAAAPAALECERFTTLEVGAGQNIVLGRILAIHVHEDAVDERFHIDPRRLDAVGRMGGAGYATTRDYFELDRLDVEAAIAGKNQERR
ncbi:NADH-FMN oxidoreductase RutF, flavin reductase (DIM6/NTAB) family [Arboricoccus pini]|uniref:NADH-FMN oxidoreductase RutF, flavin reductase (DIM6/NTAB) family n=1 Tax=Arboricoccus pini TaxID=1963835 RepID=A0A212RP24_9PROT|nr:flavin reductase family protein [Arboricoccus pini]SNB74143.1 NADH-FMN oxidoreductase RutF, flavin reductase (DIM6/NTAB) family [Arboricoccus pini]